MLDVLICTNLVNYTVAVHGVHAGQDRPAIVLHEPWRFSTRHLKRVWHLPINIWTLRLLRALVKTGVVHTLYLPHDRFNRRVVWSRDHARRLAYLDDGLDTHRRMPRNFDLPIQPGRLAYHTFAEFKDLPAWLDGFNIERGTRLNDLVAMSDRPVLPLSGIAHVFVESPGLQVGDIIERLHLPHSAVLVVRHPVPEKRGHLPAQCRVVEGGQYNLEASLLAAGGLCFYFGETLALMFAAHAGAARRNRIHAQLSAEQRKNLTGLAWVQSAPDATGLMVLAG